MTQKDTKEWDNSMRAQEVIDIFFDSGATITKKHYDYVLQIINEACEVAQQSAVEEYKKELLSKIATVTHNPDYTCGEATLCERNLAVGQIKSLINGK